MGAGRGWRREGARYDAGVKKKRAAKVFDVEAFTSNIMKERDRLAPLLPEIDPGELVLILQSVLRPFGTGRSYFIRKTKEGRFVG